jgi:hypothetical protein
VGENASHAAICSCAALCYAPSSQYLTDHTTKALSNRRCCLRWANRWRSWVSTVLSTVGEVSLLPMPSTIMRNGDASRRALLSSADLRYEQHHHLGTGLQQQEYAVILTFHRGPLSNEQVSATSPAKRGTTYASSCEQLSYPVQ